MELKTDSVSTQSKNRVTAVSKNELLNKKNKNLNAKTQAVESLSNLDIQRMYFLFSKYYNEHSFEQFTQDLYEKNNVIILRDKQSKVIQGFSTLLEVSIPATDGRICHGIFSGDTVVAKEYWGSPALGIEFLKYLWLQKLKNPFQPLYWFLISKGYKTYLLMANNFATHFPRYEKQTPHIYKNLMDQFYSRKFKDSYHSEAGLIIPKGPSCSLKESIADISDAQLKIPRIAFFQNKNPNWKNGEELCCIAEMTLIMPLQYSLKKFWKGLMR